MNPAPLWKRQARLLITILVILIGALIAMTVTLQHNRHKTYAVRTACSILTPAIAHAVGGDNLKPQALKTQKDADTETTFCVYRGNGTSVSLVVRSALTAKGAQLNKQAFSSPPVSSETLAGYGDSAYWTPNFGQLSILKHDQWYILTSGVNTPTKRTLQQSEVLANKLQSVL